MISLENDHKYIFIVMLSLIFTLFHSTVNSDEVLKADSGVELVDGEISSEHRAYIHSKNIAVQSSPTTPPKRAGLLAGVMSLLLGEKPVNKPPTVTNLEADPDSFNYPRIYTELAATVIDDGVTGTELNYQWQSIWRGDGSHYVLVNAHFDPITIESDNRISSGVAFSDDNGYLPRGLYDLNLYVDDGEYSASSSVTVYLIPYEEKCGEWTLKEGEVCVRNCNGMDLIFGDGSKNGHSRTYANCGSAAINAGLNNMGHAATIGNGLNCNQCHR